MGLREIVLGLWLAGRGGGGQRFDYDVTYGPLAGRLTLQAVRGGDGYEARVTIRSAGLAGMVRAVRFDAVAVGVAGKSLRPSYVEQADTGRRVSQMRLDWQGGLAVVTAYHADPAEVVPPQPPRMVRWTRQARLVSPVGRYGLRAGVCGV